MEKRVLVISLALALALVITVGIVTGAGGKPTTTTTTTVPTTTTTTVPTGVGEFENVQIDNYDATKPALDVYQAVRNAPYRKNLTSPDAVALLVEGRRNDPTPKNALSPILIIRSWGNSTERRESELRFDNGAWDPSNPTDYSYMQAAIYTKGNDQVLRLKPGPFVAGVLGQLRVLNTKTKSFVTQIVANKSDAASIAFVRTDTHNRDFGNETASIYRPANSRDLRVWMVGFGPVITFVGDNDDISNNTPGPYVGNVGIGTTNPKSTLQVNGYTQLALTSGAPPSADCDSASERGRMKVDSSAGLLYICVDSGWVGK